jgi:predicted metal-dependent phosphoesterase TrpH
VPADAGADRRGVDLHAHSTASDGLLTPAALVEEASRRELRVLALTDHDTLAGLPEATETASGLGIELIPGVELSAESGPHEIHILGYYVRPDDTELQAALAHSAGEREMRVARMVERLNTLGYPVALAAVREIAGDGTIGRPHIARAMIAAGYVGSLTDAFDRFLGNGKPAFVPRELTPPEDNVALLRRAGAVPVLAHPLSTGDVQGTLARLVPRGLLGVEVYYGEYSPEQRSELKAIADAWSLIATGGSDYHGPNFKEGRELGTAPVPLASARALRRAWEALSNRPA